MPFIGNQPSNNFVSLKRQDITGDGTASYTLDYKVASVNDILVYVNHVKQDPSSMTVSGTSLTMGGNVSSSDDFYVIFLGQALQTVTPADNTITTAMLQDNAVTDAKFSGTTGKILQVKSTTITDTVSINTLSYSDVTDLNVSITPSSTSNKILIICSINFGQGAAHGTFRLVRGSTAIGIGDTAGSRTTGTFVMHTGTGAQQDAGSTNFLDSPSTTSATTYKLQGRSNDSGTAMYINRSNTDSDSAAYQRVVSTITVMEVSG